MLILSVEQIVMIFNGPGSGFSLVKANVDFTECQALQVFYST